MIKDLKRFFFGFEIFTLWPELPKEKKMIDEKNRHITLLFLGEYNVKEIEKYLRGLPKLDLKVALAGYFDKCLFLPKRQPRLVAFSVDFFEKNKHVEKFQNKLVDFFKNKNFEIKQKNNFLPHVTICRNHFDMQKWQESFKPFPLYIKSINLYESLGNSEYKTIWKKDFLKPFDEISHTADIAFIIRGESYKDLLYNSFIALSFKSLDFFSYHKHLLDGHLLDVFSIDDVIINLNEIITKAEIDGKHIPFKAVSFHSDIEKKDDILSWEMIVDV